MRTEVAVYSILFTALGSFLAGIITGEAHAKRVYSHQFCEPACESKYPGSSAYATLDSSSGRPFQCVCVPREERQ